MDWLNHAQGELITPVADYQPATVQVGGSKPQSFLYDSKSFAPHCVVETCWSQAAGRLRLFSACNVPSELIYAFGPNKPGHAPLGYVVHRACPDARDVVYMNVFAFGKAGEQITSVELSESAPGEIFAEIMLNGEIHTHRFSIGN